MAASVKTDSELARQALREILLDKASPAAARATAARTLLELDGQLGRHSRPGPDDELADAFAMSRSEMQAELATGKGRKP